MWEMYNIWIVYFKYINYFILIIKIVFLFLVLCLNFINEKKKYILGKLKNIYFNLDKN